MLGNDRAKNYLDSALHLGKEMRLIKPLSDTYLYLAAFYKMAGQTDSAYFSQKKYAEYSVALDKSENNSQIIQTDTSKMTELEKSERNLQKLQKENSG